MGKLKSKQNILINKISHFKWVVSDTWNKLSLWWVGMLSEMGSGVNKVSLWRVDMLPETGSGDHKLNITASTLRF